jgi:hypothetical protein
MLRLQNGKLMCWKLVKYNKINKKKLNKSDGFWDSELKACIIFKEYIV